MRLALVLCLAAGCEKNDPRPQPDVPIARAPLDDTSFRVPAAERVVAIGDLHGDVRAARAALRLAGAIDATGAWVGGRLVVVQTGDQLDRGDDEPEILDLFERLRAEAKAAGGAFFALNGNHEVMNVQGDFRYVTPDGFHDWSGVRASGARERLVEGLPAERRGRAAAFLPGGEAARRLAKQPVVIQVGEDLFVHGGLIEQHVQYGLSRINKELEQWMAGDPAAGFPQILMQESSPIWNRDYSQGMPTVDTCQALARVLKRLSAKRLVIGHTVQSDGINSACGRSVWRIDVGLSRHYGGKPSVLEIRGDELRVID